MCGSQKWNEIHSTQISTMAEKRNPADNCGSDVSGPSLPRLQPQVNYPQHTQQQQTWPQQPPTIVLQVRPAKRYDNFSTAKSQSMGISQIVCGVLAVILNAVGLSLQHQAEYDVRSDYDYKDYGPFDGIYAYGSYHWSSTTGIYVSAGFWCPFFFFISGALAIGASKRPIKCLVIGCLVMTIVSTVMAVVMFSMATWAMADDIKRLSKGFEYTVSYSGYINDTYYQPDPAEEQKYNNVAEQLAKACMPVSFLYFCVSIVEVIVTIWGCVVCCAVLCCGEDQDNDAGAVRYLPNQGQLLVLDRHGRPITDAQVIQIPALGAGQSTGPVMPAGQLYQPQGQFTQTPGHVAQTAWQTQPTDQNMTSQGQGATAPAQPPPYTSQPEPARADFVDDVQGGVKRDADVSSPPPPY